VNDDEILRRALHRSAEPISSYRVLQDLRPSMRRARRRRRAALGATAAMLLVGGGAGVLALTSAPSSSTVRTTSPADDSGAVASTLPPVIDRDDGPEAEPPSETNPVTTAPLAVPIQPPTTGSAENEQVQITEQPAEAPEAETDPTPEVVTPPPPPAQPTPSTMPPTTAAPVVPPPPSSQVLSSACGDVVVEISGGTVRIASIAPLPGYTARVSTDGPESVEMTFLGGEHGCEVHAEVTSGGLEVEIQNADDD
jgi:hypothetical protein